MEAFSVFVVSVGSFVGCLLILRAIVKVWKARVSRPEFFDLVEGLVDGETIMASSSSATAVEASCFSTAREGECDSSAVDGVAAEETKSVRAEAGPTAARSEYFSARHEEMMKSRGKFPDDGVAQEIEFSKTHWSDVTRTEVAPLSAEEEALNRDNRKIFQELKREHGYESIFVDNLWACSQFMAHANSEWTMGRMIAKGGQAEIYEVEGNPYLLLKVFESGISFAEFRKMWPLPVVKREVPHCIRGVRILNDGRFAFFMDRYWGDMRKLIDQAMIEKKVNDGIYGPPFPYQWNGFTIGSEDIMQSVAEEMMDLHKAGVFHRDLKASNILLLLPSKNMFLTFNFLIIIADFECSIGVKGSKYWRAPEVLSALALEKKEEKEWAIEHIEWEKADVYSFGMVYFEVVTGRIPFDYELGESKNDRAHVIEGKRPRLPSDLDGEVKNLIFKCWDPNPNMRPTFREIIQLLKAMTSKQCQFKLFGIEDEIPLPYHLATIEDILDYPWTLSRAIPEEIIELGFHPRIRLHLGDGSIDIRGDMPRKAIFNYKVARLCCIHCKHKDDNIF